MVNQRNFLRAGRGLLPHPKMRGLLPTPLRYNIKPQYYIPQCEKYENPHRMTRRYTQIYVLTLRRVAYNVYDTWLRLMAANGSVSKISNKLTAHLVLRCQQLFSRNRFLDNVFCQPPIERHLIMLLAAFKIRGHRHTRILVRHFGLKPPKIPIL